MNYRNGFLFRRVCFNKMTGNVLALRLLNRTADQSCQEMYKEMVLLKAFPII